MDVVIVTYRLDKEEHGIWAVCKLDAWAETTKAMQECREYFERFGDVDIYEEVWKVVGT